MSKRSKTNGAIARKTHPEQIGDESLTSAYSRFVHAQYIDIINLFGTRGKQISPVARESDPGLDCLTQTGSSTIETGSRAARNRSAPAIQYSETERTIMARRCELSGKGAMSGNNVSHAQNKTRRRFLPNLCDVTLMSEKLNRSYKFRIAASTLRTVDRVGGLDNYLVKAQDDRLSPAALKVKRELLKTANDTAA